MLRIEYVEKKTKAVIAETMNPVIKPCIGEQVNISNSIFKVENITHSLVFNLIVIELAYIK